MKNQIIYSTLLSLALMGCGEEGANSKINNVLPKSSKYTTLSNEDLLVDTVEYINATPEENIEDWYKFTINNIGSYAFYGKTLEGTVEGNHRIKFSLYNSKGIEYKTMYSEVLLSGNNEGLIIDSIDIVEKGDYYLKISRVSTLDNTKLVDAMTKYSFSIKPSVANGLVQNSNGEYNDFKFMATPVKFSDLKDTITDSVYLTRNTDIEDFYKVNLSKGDYALYFNTKEGTFDNFSNGQVNIYNESGIKIKSLDTNYLIGANTKQYMLDSFTADESENYYIGVTRTSPYILKYDLKILPSNSNDLIENNEGEYNDFIFMATPLNNSQLINGYTNSIYITNENDFEDWYSFTLNDIGNYDLEVTILNNTLDNASSGVFTITDEKSIPISALRTNILNSTGIGTTSNKEFSILKKGTYYINIKRNNRYTNKAVYAPMTFKFSITKK